MKRRGFLQRIALSSGAIVLGAHCSRPDQGGTTIADNPAASGMAFNGSILEPAREIPVADSVDVLVVGGGPSGVAAAVSASRAGASTLLVERYNHLGGLWTGGLVLPLLSTHGLDKNNRQIRAIHGIGNEIYERLRDMDMAIEEVNPVIDPEAGKYILEVMLKESGVKVYYHSWAAGVITEDETIRAVLLETKSGRVAIRPKVVVDCSGDGDVFHWAGEGYETMKYEIGLVHRLGNVDRVRRDVPGYSELHLGDRTPIPSVNWVNMTGGDYQDALDFKHLSELQTQHRIEIWEKVQQIRQSPGYEEVFLLDTAPQQGVRISRVLDGIYKLTLKDSMTYRNFKDSVGLSGAWINVLYEGERIDWKRRPVWQIPFRSLVPKKTRNLLVAGRCFSFEESLFQDTRIIGTCLVTGHGAGAGAAIAVDSGNPVQDLDIEKIQGVLKNQGARLS